MKPNVGVIGAGIGGLVAGNYLVQSGYPVTLFEGAVTPGGSAGFYRRRGFQFPTGATIAFGFETGGIMSQILQELQIDLPIRTLDHPMDVIVSDRSVSIYQNKKQWEQELADVFSERKDQVIAFWQHLSKIASDVYAISNTRAALPISSLADLGRLPSLVARRPQVLVTTISYIGKTVYQLLQKYDLHLYTPFVEFLNAQLQDSVQTDIQHAALLPAALALEIYRFGSFAIEGGFATLSQMLAGRFEETGGKFIYRTSIVNCKFDALNDSWHLYSAKGEVGGFQELINAAGLPASLFHPNGSSLSHGLSSDEIKWGAIRLDAVFPTAYLAAHVPELTKLQFPFAFQMIPSRTHAHLFGDLQGPVYMTLHRNCSVGNTPTLSQSQATEIDGFITMTVSVHTPAASWINLSSDIYSQRKQAVTEAILLECEKVLPCIRKHLVVCHTGTPATYHKYIGKSEVGGFPLTNQQAILKPRGSRTSMAHLYEAGEHVFPGPGTLSAALSGYFAARTLQSRSR